MQNERKHTGTLIALLLIIILLLLSLVGFFIYNDYYLKEDSKTITTETNNKDTEEITTSTLSESEALGIAQTTYENIYHKFNNGDSGIWADNNETSFKKSLELYFTEGAVTSTINGREFFEINSLLSCVDATYTDLSLVLFDDNYIVAKGYIKFIDENGTSYEKSFGERYIIFVKSNNSWLVASYQ